ncbi:MAG: ASCH domain-containing protein [Anaerolineae bacterium]|nr:ASCH domain-containing protein [Anaerolineae bacterium]
MNKTVRKFWKQYLATLPPEEKAGRSFTAWSFGNSPEMADRLGDLTRQGVKTATSALLWEFEATDEALPKPGDLNIILNGKGEPLCIVETVEIEIKPFDQVDERFAWEEGEGSRTLEYWRAVHWEFFGQSCARIGRQPNERMPVVCERFRLVFP